jgi:hypothetical protein
MIEVLKGSEGGAFSSSKRRRRELGATVDDGGRFEEEFVGLKEEEEG